jgi:hypothetical protein
VEATVTGGVHLDMLEQFVYPQAAGLQPNIIYQQDRAPPHWSLHVRETLMRNFPDRWIGSDGPIFWPPRSPDITQMDFFFWGYVKERVYATRVSDLPALRDLPLSVQRKKGQTTSTLDCCLLHSVLYSQH